MIKKVYDALVAVFGLAGEVRDLRVELEETKAQLKTISANSAHRIGGLREAFQWLVNEVQRVREDDAHEREKLELRLEVQRLRAFLSPAAGMPPPEPPGA